MKKEQEFEYYRGCSFMDLIEDRGFRQWVFEPTAESHAFWSNIQDCHPELSVAISEGREFLLGTKSHFEDVDVPHEAVFEQFKKFDHSRKERQIDRIRTRNNFRRKLLTACISLLLIVGFWFAYESQSSMVEYTTQYGQWKTITLPDGSLVKLNANSKLKTLKDWDHADVRKVWLEGEAFFTVAKKNNGTLKFQVMTDDLTVEVLGTEFSVYDRGATEVYLEEGSVKLDLGMKEETMEPGDFVSYKKETNDFEKSKKKLTEEVTSWKLDVLNMKNAPISQILDKIEETYGMDILLESQAIQKDSFNFAIPMKEIDVVIPIMERVLDVQIIREDERLILKSTQ